MVSTKKIDLMHEMFGEDPEHKCAECENLISHTANTANRIWYKCSCYGDTSSEATDWRLKYTACELFNMPYKGTPIIEIKKHMTRVDASETYECEGQMSIEDYLNSL